MVFPDDSAGFPINIHPWGDYFYSHPLMTFSYTNFNVKFNRRGIT